MGRQLINLSMIGDSEVEGVENLEVFKSFWSKQHIPHSKLSAAGFQVTSEDVRVTTEQLEPALLLADYAAGLGLAAATKDPGKLRMPLDQAVATRLLFKLRAPNKLVIVDEDFQYSFDEIFSDAMDMAREIGDRPPKRRPPHGDSGS